MPAKDGGVGGGRVYGVEMEVEVVVMEVEMDVLVEVVTIKVVVEVKHIPGIHQKKKTLNNLNPRI